MVQNKAKFKKSSWTKKKAKSGGKQAQDPVPSASSGTKPSPSAGSTCFYCKADGHWKRNCSKYLVDKAKSGGMTSDSGTLVCNVIYIYILLMHLIVLGYMIPDHLFTAATRCRD